MPDPSAYFALVRPDGVSLASTTADAVKVTLNDSAGTPIGALAAVPWFTRGASVQIGTSNSTLGASSTYTSGVVSVEGYSRIVGIAYADQPSAASGLSVQQASRDTTNFDYSETFSVTAAVALPFSVETVGQYAKVQFINGSTAQDTFRIRSYAR